MENNVRKELDKFILEKEEEYREVISFVGYSMFEYLSEIILSGGKNSFEIGFLNSYAESYTIPILKTLKKQTDERNSKMICPNTIAVEYYSNEELIERFGCLTNYVLYLSNEIELSEKQISNSSIKHDIISNILVTYFNKPFFLKILIKKLEQEFYIKTLCSKSEIPVFSIDLDKYLDNTFNNYIDVEKPKIKSL